MTGLKGDAAIVGLVELAPVRRPSAPSPMTLEQIALLASRVIEDAGIEPTAVDGIITTRIAESTKFVPSTIVEYLGLPVNYAEFVDLGGANATAGVWRAAAAIELGLCSAVLVVIPGAAESLPTPTRRPAAPTSYFGASSAEFGSPQAEFEIPYGLIGQNVPYAQIARRYGDAYGYDSYALAKIAADQRTNACATPDAVFFGKKITVEDVLASPIIADPIHMLEVVMPCQGGAGVLVVNRELAAQSKHRPAWVTGFGERVTNKSLAYAKDLLVTPMEAAAQRAFAMANIGPGEVDLVSLYDCYTITVLMTLEDAGFCPRGEGARFVRDHDLTFRGDFPLNTAGGQLSFGQAGAAGGMHHVCDAVRQIMGRAGDAQLKQCATAFVSGNGGIMSEQIALILQGER
ncbi:MAG TPA: thiolase family protein [Acidimicrobiia bacterium]|nr:thiolase family protein [Acidimicrobiia bacterium]